MITPRADLCCLALMRWLGRADRHQLKAYAVAAPSVKMVWHQLGADARSVLVCTHAITCAPCCQQKALAEFRATLVGRVTDSCAQSHGPGEGVLGPGPLSLPLSSQRQAGGALRSFLGSRKEGHGVHIAHPACCALYSPQQPLPSLTCSPRSGGQRQSRPQSPPAHCCGAQLAWAWQGARCALQGLQCALRMQLNCRGHWVLRCRWPVSEPVAYIHGHSTGGRGGGGPGPLECSCQLGTHPPAAGA
jgi:hypothetical protein